MSDSKISSINLENWIWDWISTRTNNRSRFLNNLIKEEIKGALLENGVMSENDEVTEMYGELYLNIIIYKRNLKKPSLKRIPVRSGGLIKNESFQKKAISILMEKWLWDLTGKIEPNRSLYFKRLIIARIKNELIRSRINYEDKLLDNEIYLMQLTAQ